MTNPLHASFYADQAVFDRVAILQHEQLARDTFRVRFAFPKLARRITPGQFVMLRLADDHDPLIGRPLALYETTPAEPSPESIDVVYLKKGKFTSKLATYQEGQELEAWGPLGNGFCLPGGEHLIMVSGGIGQTPMLALAQEALGQKTYGIGSASNGRYAQVSFCYGARNAAYFAGLDDFRNAGVDMRLATDDGSAGHPGLVTDLLRQTLAGCSNEQLRNQQVHIACCGPEPMMEAVAEIASEVGLPCQISLETPMACGIGICFTCVAKIRDDSGDWDYKRTCVEGPVFEASKIVW